MTSTHETARVEVSGVHRGQSALRYVPAFLGVLILYLIGVSVFRDPRATFIHLGPYEMSWAEVLLTAAALIGMGEQLKVSHPGIDNTMEAIVMAALAGLQVLLLALAAAGVSTFAMFNTTEFLILTLIGMVAAVIALLINARTLRRTIGVGDGS